MRVDNWLFQVRNKHSSQAGESPQIDGNTPNRYHGYFENEHGEQFVFIYDRETNKGLLWAGDAGWERPYAVFEGLAPELIMNETEETWLQACWNAATEFEK